MAENNPIKYSDLIKPDDSIDNLIKQIGQLIVTYEHLHDVVMKDASDMINVMRKTSGASAQGRKEIDEESKEAEKLAQAHKALRDAQTDTAKQLAVLNELKRQQMQMNREDAKLVTAQEGSYNHMAATYAKLKREIKNMNPVTEEAKKLFAEKEAQAKKLQERMNEIQVATGKYVLQVGNYNIAGERMAQILKKGKEALYEMERAGKANTAEYIQLAQSLADTRDQMSDTDAMLKNMASDTWALDATLQGLAAGAGGFAAVTGAMQLFGAESDAVEEAQRKLQAAIALVNGVTAIQNALQKQSALVTRLKAEWTMITSKFTKENTATTIANTAAIKAQGVATETTTKATKGLGKALNALKSNPVKLILSAAVALGVATVAIVKKVRAAQKEAYEQELKNLESTEAKRKVAMQEHETSISKYQQEIKLAQAEGKSQEEIMQLREKELRERSDMAQRSTAWNKTEIDNLEKNKKKLLENQATLKAADAEQIKLKQYKREEIEAENALLEKQIEIAEKQLEVNRELDVEFAAYAEERRQLAIETAAAEEDSLRQLEDARNNLIKNAFKRERTITAANYDRQIADLKTRLENERNLTEKQVKNINALIIELEKTKNVEIAKINADERAANLQSYRQTQDMWLAISQDGMQKERAQLDINYQRETDDLRTKLQNDRDLTLQEQQAINVQLYLMQVKYLQDVAKLNEQVRANELNKELKAIELRKAAQTKGGENMTDALREIEIKRELELKANKELAVEMRQDEMLINAKYDTMRLQTEDKIRREAAERVLSIQQELAKSEIDIANTTENKKNAMRLQLEKEALEKKLELNEQANIKMSEEEAQTIRNQITKLEQDIKKSKAPQDLYDVLGLNVTDEQKEAMNESYAYAKEALQSFFDYKMQLTQRSIDLANQEVEAAQNTLNAERQARAAGYANNVAMAEKELAAAKQQQRKALKQQEEAQKAQQRLQTIEQAVNMVTASAKVMATFPFPYSLPVLALMWGTFIASKVKAKQLASEQYGEGTVELLEGGSHQSGNDIDLGRKKDGTRRRAEGGEFFAVINKRSSRKYRKEIPEIINSLNKGEFAEKYANAYNQGTAIITTFDGKAELKSIAKDIREIKERGKNPNVIYTPDGRIERFGNITRIIRK